MSHWRSSSSANGGRKNGRRWSQKTRGHALAAGQGRLTVFRSKYFFFFFFLFFLILLTIFLGKEGGSARPVPLPNSGVGGHHQGVLEEDGGCGGREQRQEEAEEEGGG